jgi:hypothetical protein
MELGDVPKGIFYVPPKSGDFRMLTAICRHYLIRHFGVQSRLGKQIVWFGFISLIPGSQTITPT